jgi:hypothetical protein
MGMVQDISLSNLNYLSTSQDNRCHTEKLDSIVYVNQVNTAAPRFLIELF